MTQQRRDSHSTEFGLWLRDQKEIDSGLGYVATNIDYLWRNYKTGKWMLIEEKRYGRKAKYPQTALFELLDKACQLDNNYYGFHYLIFENTSPDDGKIFLDNKEITKDELLQFLLFETDPVRYHERAH